MRIRKLSICSGILIFFMVGFSSAQQTFPENGVADNRHVYYAFTNATIVKDETTTLKNATLPLGNGGSIVRINIDK